MLKNTSDKKKNANMSDKSFEYEREAQKKANSSPSDQEEENGSKQQ